MSYILDALRRADAERRRAQAPALQQVTQGPGWGEAPTAPAPRRRAWPVLAGTVVLVSAALLVYRQTRPGDAPREAAASAPAAAAMAPLPAALPVPQPAPAPAAPVAATAAAPPLPSPVAPAAPATPAAPMAAAAAAPAAAPHPVAPAATPLAAAEEPLPAAALPEPQRARLAALAIGGAVHSQERTQSFVLVAGQPLREGQAAAPGVTIERIEPRALLLRVDGRLVRWPL